MRKCDASQGFGEVEDNDEFTLRSFGIQPTFYPEIYEVLETSPFIGQHGITLFIGGCESHHVVQRTDNWDEFNDKVRALYEENPMRCRITLKYRHNDGKLEVKATNDKKVYKYQSVHQKEIKNIDKMISTYVMAMTQ